MTLIFIPVTKCPSCQDDMIVAPRKIRAVTLPAPTAKAEAR